MSMRFVDFLCDVCGDEWEQLVYSDEKALVNCCGVAAKKIWKKAPGVHYMPHYSHALGRKVSTYREEEKALQAKDGSWIASKSEANRLMDGDGHAFDDSVVIKKNKERIKKYVEKSAQKLVSDGRIRFHD